MSRAAVRRFLARGRSARLAACLVVAFAAVVWVAVASVLLHVLVAAALVLLVIGCMWLIAGVWRGESADAGEFGVPAWRSVLRWVRLAVARPEGAPTSPDGERARSTVEDEDLEKRERELAEREAAFATARSSVDQAIADLVRRQERLHTDAEQLEQKLAGQIDAMRAVVARMAQLEEGASVRASAQPKLVEPALTGLDRPAEFDLEAARVELEADLRLEKIEQQEQELRELEEQLRRREDQLADFVAQAQGRLNPRALADDPERILLS